MEGIDTSKWKDFRVGDLFTGYESKELDRCKCHASGALTPGNDIKYIGAKKSGNGYMKTVMYDKNIITRGNCIIFICNGDGSVGYTNYMDEDFIGTADLMVGYNPNLNKYIGAFIVTVLDLEREKYSFARKWGTFVEDTLVRLPANGKEPDWKYMEEFMKKLDSDINDIPEYFLTEGCDKAYWYLDNIDNILFEKKYAACYSNLTISLEDRKWKDFYLEEFIPDIHNGKSYNSNDLVISDSDDYVAYITRTDNNNGISKYVEAKEYDGLELAGAITIGDTTATIFYQNHKFITGPHVVVLRAKWMNVYTANFIISLLNMEKFRYPVFGRAYTKELIKKTKVKLPINHKKEPDFKFMEDYIKCCSFSCNI